jgi:hypothetical protein
MRPNQEKKTKKRRFILTLAQKSLQPALIVLSRAESIVPIYHSRSKPYIYKELHLPNLIPNSILSGRLVVLSTQKNFEPFVRATQWSQSKLNAGHFIQLYLEFRFCYLPLEKSDGIIFN